MGEKKLFDSRIHARVDLILRVRHFVQKGMIVDFMFPLDITTLFVNIICLTNR